MQIDYLSNHKHLIPELAQLHFSEWGHYRPGDTVEARAERLRASCGKDSLPTVIVALLGSELCGSAMLVANDMDTRPDLSPWLAGVYVKTQHRHSGIGSALIMRIAGEATALGVSRLYLCTDGSESLYARLGWSAVERSPYKGITVTVMARDLPPNNSFKPKPLRGSA
jgi:predicted N-acetyltransferase YhbS